MSAGDPPRRTREPSPWQRTLSPAGLILAGLLFTAALTPSLMPREPAVQGALAGLLAALGHEIGGLAEALWRWLGLPRLRRFAAERIAAFAVAAAIVSWGLLRAADWQNATRRTVGIHPVDTSHPLTIAATALAVFAAVWLVVRGAALLTRRGARALDRILPPRVGVALAAIAVAWLLWALIDGVLLRRALAAADASFAAADALDDPDIAAPTTAERTGGPGSLVRWDEMGRWGRAFVANAPTAAEIGAFTQPARDPVRVYVGRRSAGTAEARAELALEEAIRLGAFDRAALLVTVPVGTGWMDPGQHDSFDFILGGDTATIAVQYSYLTSVLSLLVAPEYGVEQARALFDAIYDHWRTLPEATRPAFYVAGLSQGALNTQFAVPLLDLIAEPIDGALWAGSPFLAPFWAHVRDNRNPASAAWRPRFGNGSLVRTANQRGGLDRFDADWGPMRFVFLNYGSDAIVNFTFDSLFRRPAWMRPDRAFDVTPEFRWFPLVTGVQLALDMAVSLQVPRFGHFYVAPDYIDAWAEVLGPEGWTPARAEALKRVFAQRPPPF